MEDLLEAIQWMAPLGVPVVTGMFALAGAWVGGRLGKHNEHTQWRRNERLKAYTDFLAAINGEIQKVSHWRDTRKERVEFPANELARIELVGSQKVRVLARKFQDHLNVYRNTATSVYQNGELPDMPVETKNRNVNQYTKAAARLTEIKDAYVLAVRKDLDTYARRDNQTDGLYEGVDTRS